MTFPKTIHQRQENSMKIISDTAHGILDYLTVAIFALAPGVLGLTGFAALVSYALAAIHLIMTLLTNMPLGVVKIIPMRLHALVEMLVGPVLVVAALVLPTHCYGARSRSSTNSSAPHWAKCVDR